MGQEEQEQKPFITSVYGKITISELRLILKTKGSIDLWYDVYFGGDDTVDGPSLIWNISKIGKEYKLIRYLSIGILRNHNLVGNYVYNSNRSEEYIPEEIIGNLKTILTYINFHKHFKVVKELINPDNIDIIAMVGDSNSKSLPFDKYYRDENYSFENDSCKIFKWYQEDYFRVFKHALEYLGISYKPDKFGITWWYLGQKFITKVESFGQIGYGVCYRLDTIAIERHSWNTWDNLSGPIKKIRLHDIKSTSSWLSYELLDCILAVNILKSGTIFMGATKISEFNGLKDISTVLINKKILHAGDPTYVVDSVFDEYGDKDQWIKGSRYLKSQFPDINKICEEAKNFLLELDQNIISKLKELGIKNVILGYYGFREMYVHPNPYNHSSMCAWRFNNPITLNVETGVVEYHHLHNNEKLQYPRIKIIEQELLVEAYVRKLIDYCYRIPLKDSN